MTMGRRSLKKICLFDMDGTITQVRKKIDAEMRELLIELQKQCPIGLITGSDLKSAERQLGHELIQRFDYVFVENGAVAYRNGDVIAEKNISEEMGEAKLQEVINFVLHYLADIQLPVKRGCFVEYRKGMINIAPMGRCNLTFEDRRIFCEYDKTHKVREKMVNTLQKRFANSGLVFCIGGQTSFDVFPIGWDKTSCLDHLGSEFDQIYFFGDMTAKGGNDYELYHDPRTTSYTVTSPKDTGRLVRQLFLNDSTSRTTAT
ncbi:uncharacterized protein [Diadema antillarum]|uniref:uncharacterized protein n=1 Tax=Diadema antillarum TaxID=105358 RepID=UPI003A84C6F6